MFFAVRAGRRNGKAPEYAAAEIVTSMYAGQGVLYNQEEGYSYFVTAAHVMEGCQMGDTCQVTWADGSVVKAEYVYCSETADMAFLQVETKLLPKKTGVIKKNKEIFDSLKEGDVLQAYYLWNGKPEYAEGSLIAPWIYLDDFSINMMLVKLDAATLGMSGCPVLTEDGYFAGILCGISEEGETAVLPFSVIESEWLQFVKSK
jgi:hypothetical protein